MVYLEHSRPHHSAQLDTRSNYDDIVGVLVLEYWPVLVPPKMLPYGTLQTS
jgi:hypothetical protein